MLKTSGRLAVGACVALTLLCTACSGGSSSNSANDTDPNMPQWEKELMDAAPVADPNSIPAGALAEANKRGVLNWGGGKAIPLVSVLNPITNRVEGFDATNARLLAKYVTGKPNVNPVLVTAETRPTLVNDGSVDAVLYNYSMTPEREKEVDFAGPYLVTGTGIMVREENQDIHSVQDLAGKKVCVTTGGLQFQQLKQLVPTAEAVPVDSPAACETALRQGRAEATLQTKVTELGQMSKAPGLKVLPGLVSEEKVGIGLKNNSPEAVKFVDAWIQQLIDKGIWQKAYANTYGTVDKESPIIPKPGEHPGAQ